MLLLMSLLAVDRITGGAVGRRQDSFLLLLLLLRRASGIEAKDRFSWMSLYLACLRAFSCCFRAGEAFEADPLGPALPSDASEPANANLELLEGVDDPLPARGGGCSIKLVMRSLSDRLESSDVKVDGDTVAAKRKIPRQAEAFSLGSCSRLWHYQPLFMAGALEDGKPSVRASGTPALVRFVGLEAELSMTGQIHSIRIRSKHSIASGRPTQGIQSFVVIASPPFDTQDRRLRSRCSRFTHIQAVVLESKKVTFGPRRLDDFWISYRV